MEIMLSKDLKDVRDSVMWISSDRIFQAEEEEIPKAKMVCPSTIQEIVKGQSSESKRKGEPGTGGDGRPCGVL